MRDVQQGVGVDDWRVLDTSASAWFAAPSHSAGAALVGRIAELSESTGLPDVDLRASGVRVRLGPGNATDLTPADAGLARGISAAAQDLGLATDPSVLQAVHFAFDAVDPIAVKSFWQTALAYQPAGEDVLVDPWSRDPSIWFHRESEPRPLRNRLHVDVIRGPEAVEGVTSAVGRDPFGPYQARLADVEGNEIDLLAGDPLSEGPETTDWLAVLSAMTFYPTPSSAQASDLARTVAGLADEAGVPLMIDLRADGVTIDSGKDQWEDDGHGSGERFVALAGRIQSAAHAMGLVADLSHLRFVQLGVDAVDIPAVRAFWTAALGYQHDPREHVTDIYDPRRLNPVVFFQDLEASEDDRRRQRNRIHLDLFVPHDHAQARVDAALGAGGRILGEQSADGCTVADPEGNEVHLIAS